MAESDREFHPDQLDLDKDLDELILGASSYKNMSPYFSYLAERFDRSAAALRSRYNYLRRRADKIAAQPMRRGRPRKADPGSEGELVQIFSEIFRVKPSKEAIGILRDCINRYGLLRVAMAMERVRPEGGEIFARAIASELGKGHS